jgi:hypothetical protein
LGGVGTKPPVVAVIVAMVWNVLSPRKYVVLSAVPLPRAVVWMDAVDVPVMLAADVVLSAVEAWFTDVPTSWNCVPS